MKTSRTNQIARVFLLATLVFFAAQLTAQESFTLKGRIVNTSKSPVSKAVATLLNPVTLEPIGYSMCDRNGEFSIDNVRQGEYILSVQKEGYTRAQSKTIVIDSNGNYTEKSVVMNNTKHTHEDLVANK